MLAFICTKHCQIHDNNVTTKDNDVKQNNFDGHANISFTRGYIVFVLSQAYIVAIATHLRDDDDNDDDDMTTCYAFRGII